MRSRFAFPRARIRLGAARFELSFWDYEPLFALLALGTVVVALAIEGGQLARGCLAATVLGMISARRVLVVAQDAAWFEHRVFGMAWRRLPLGLRPAVTSGVVWDWSEISVVPTDAALRAPLHDGERAVLAEWSADDPRADAEALQLAALAQREIARLHG
jgi:hypothetical protein